MEGYKLNEAVSTHSRPKAAGAEYGNMCLDEYSFNTQPPEGGWNDKTRAWRYIAQFQHTAARRRLAELLPRFITADSFNTQPPEGGWQSSRSPVSVDFLFQHTAARRRLD